MGRQDPLEYDQEHRKLETSQDHTAQAASQVGSGLLIGSEDWSNGSPEVEGGGLWRGCAFSHVVPGESLNSEQFESFSNCGPT